MNIQRTILKHSGERVRPLWRFKASFMEMETAFHLQILRNFIWSICFFNQPFVINYRQAYMVPRLEPKNGIFLVGPITSKSSFQKALGSGLEILKYRSMRDGVDATVLRADCPDCKDLLETDFACLLIDVYNLAYFGKPIRHAFTLTTTNVDSLSGATTFTIALPLCFPTPDITGPSSAADVLMSPSTWCVGHGLPNLRPKMIHAA